MQGRRRERGVPEALHVEMGVDIDEPRAHDEPVGVDRPASGVRHGTDRDDASTVDRDVRPLAGGSGAVDDLTPADDDVVHGSSW